MIDETKLAEALPYGSGIDGSWSVEKHKNGNVTARCSYHLMNEHGYYDGWQDFYVRLFHVKADRYNRLKGPCAGLVQRVETKGAIDFSVHFSSPRAQRASAFGLKDCLEDVIGHSLREAGIVTSNDMPTLRIPGCVAGEE